MQFILLFLFLPLLGSTASSFTITVSAAKTQCFHEIATEGERVHGSYEVVSANNQAIFMTVTDMNGDKVFFSDEREMSFEFIAQITGRYEICFDNKKGKLSSKRVSFGFEVTHAMDRDALHPSSY